jgi:hypothetical protein
MSEIIKKAGLILAFLSVSTLSGCGQGSSKNPVIPNVTGPNVNYVSGIFTLSTTITNLSIDTGVRLPIPNLPNSYLEVGPDLQTNGYMINLGISAADLKTLIANNATVLDPTTLPGGRPLPGVSAGQLPGFGVQVPQLDNVAFYVGSTVFGVFIPVSLPWQSVIGTYRFYDGTGTQIGNLSAVGTDTTGKNSGILLLIDLNGTVGQIVSTATP